MPTGMTTPPPSAGTTAALVVVVDDLIKQATTERSHYYTASILTRCRAALLDQQAEIERLSAQCREQDKELADWRQGIVRGEK